VSDANPLVLPKGFRINCPVIGHTVVGRMVQETEKSTAVTMSWFRGAPRVDVIDGTAGHLLDEHAYVPCCFCSRQGKINAVTWYSIHNFHNYRILKV